MSIEACGEGSARVVVIQEYKIPPEEQSQLKPYYFGSGMIKLHKHQPPSH